jgi:hypothetical protein
MNKTAIRLTAAIALALFGARGVHARGFGGAHAGGGYSAGGSHGGYHSSSASGEVYHGPEGTTVAHGSAGVHGAAAGPNGAAAGGKEVSGTAVKGPEGNEYTHETSAGRGAAAGPDGVEAGHYGTTGSTYHGAGDATYAHGAAGYSAAGYGAGHVALPTDAGYGMSAARTGTAAYAGAGYHQTEAVSGSVAAARGAAVRNAYSVPGLYGHQWQTANPGAWAPAGWTGQRAWGTATWPTVGATLDWGNTAPIAYNYGTNITYQDNQVCYGDRPVATAAEYYQQAATLADSAPAAAAPSDDWLPLGVFALVQKEQADPNFVMHLAINKSGAVAGNYTDVISGTNRPIHGAVDKKTQRVAWTIGNNKNTVGETGLYNLTQDEAPALIHIGKDKTQQWLLVRLQPPEQASGGP